MDLLAGELTSTRSVRLLGGATLSAVNEPTPSPNQTMTSGAVAEPATRSSLPSESTSPMSSELAAVRPPSITGASNWNGAHLTDVSIAASAVVPHTSPARAHRPFVHDRPGGQAPCVPHAYW